MKKNEINPLRNWAINLIPLPCPEIIDINIKDIKNQFSTNYVAGTVDLAVLEQPVLDASKFKKLQPKSISSYLISFKIDISENKFLFDYQDIECISYRFHAVEIPKIRTLQISESWEYPRIVDLFFNLKQPLRDGKSYVRYKDTYEQTSLLSEKADGDGEREINSETPQVKYIFTKKQPYKKEKIIDLFDLLLPYLQPPIDAILDMPLQWPPDRRPYDYQLTGVKFLAERPNALLGDEMGLGKTVQTIVALQMLYRKGQIRRTLILCPKSLLATWERELNKWAPEFYVTKIRGDRNSRFKLWESSSPIFITTYDTWREDAEQICENKGADTFQIAILDEIQRIKNPGTKINKAVTMLNPKFRWGLSGTPLENAISDVVTIFSFLKPRLFNTKNQVSGETVRKTIAPYFLRRRTSEVYSELPAKINEEIWLELTEEQSHAYEIALHKARKILSNEATTRMHIFEQISQLRQICNADPTSGSSCKVEYLIDQLESVVANKQKALVFSEFANVTLAPLEKTLSMYSVARYHGALPDRKREQLRHQFETQDEPQIMLVSYGAGGIGLTLVGANHVFLYDKPWNPATVRQAEARAHRIGQDKTVFVYDIYTIGTIEERIHQILKNKQLMFDEVIDSLTNNNLDNLTEDDLFGLFDIEVPKRRPSIISSKNSIKKARSTIEKDILPPKKKLPTQILILSANPYDAVNLKLAKEVREIRTILRQANYRDNFNIIQHDAVRVTD